MGGIISLGNALAILAAQAGTAADEIDRTTDASNRLPKDQHIVTDKLGPQRTRTTSEPAPVDALARRSFGVTSRTAFEEWSGMVDESTTEMRDFLAELRGGTDVGTLVPNQREIIDQIQDTPFGAYLGRAAELLIEKLQAGFRLDPWRDKVIQEALYAKDIGARDIIKRLTGKAGQAFNWDQFETDIKALVAAQQNVKKATSGLNKAAKSSSSGALGKTKPASCGAESSLDMLLKSGALR